MSICLLLSKDASLQSEIESGLSLLDPSPTLLSLDHDRDLIGVLDSLSDVKLLLVDRRYFTLPTRTDLPVVVLDHESSPPIPHPCPCILLPFRSAELTSLVQYFLNNGQEGKTVRGWNPLSFFLRVQREILHDLNNQQTTIQGHLPLLTDTCRGEEKEILTDIQRAAEHAAGLLKKLEAMNPDAAYEAGTLSVTPFLKTLSGIARRILGDSTPAEFQYPEEPAAVWADEALLSLCLLTGLDVFSSTRHSCTLQVKPAGTLFQFWILGSPSAGEIDASLLTHLNQRLHPMGAKVSFSAEGLCYTLKIAPSTSLLP